MLPVTDALGDFVRARREELGYTSLGAFSRATNVNIATLSRLEGGKQDNVAPETLARIAQGLRMTVLELREHAGMLTAEEANRRRGMPTVEDAVRADADLTEDQREVLRAVYYSWLPWKRDSGRASDA